MHSITNGPAFYSVLDPDRTGTLIFPDEQRQPEWFPAGGTLLRDGTPEQIERIQFARIRRSSGVGRGLRRLRNTMAIRDRNRPFTIELSLKADPFPASTRWSRGEAGAIDIPLFNRLSTWNFNVDGEVDERFTSRTLQPFDPSYVPPEPTLDANGFPQLSEPLRPNAEWRFDEAVVTPRFSPFTNERHLPANEQQAGSSGWDVQVFGDSLLRLSGEVTFRIEEQGLVRHETYDNFPASVLSRHLQERWPQAEPEEHGMRSIYRIATSGSLSGGRQEVTSDTRENSTGLTDIAPEVYFRMVAVEKVGERTLSSDRTFSVWRCLVTLKYITQSGFDDVTINHELEFAVQECTEISLDIVPIGIPSSATLQIPGTSLVWVGGGFRDPGRIERAPSLLYAPVSDYLNRFNFRHESLMRHCSGGDRDLVSLEPS